MKIKTSSEDKNNKVKEAKTKSADKYENII